MEEFSISLLIFSFSVLLFPPFITFSSAAPDTISTIATGSLKVGDTVVSAGEIFELGFFSAGNSGNTYLGIWYKKVSPPTYVWVANRETPINDSSGVLELSHNGMLTISSARNKSIWVSSNSSNSVKNPVAQLLDSGNFVIREQNGADPQKFLWQSFDYPCDTFLPQMKIGVDLQTGLERYLSSWKSNDDPSHGDYTLRLDPRGFPQLVVRRGSVTQFRIGPFGGTPHLKENPVYKFGFEANQKEIYYTYDLLGNRSSTLTRVVLNQLGTVQRFTWRDQTQAWELYLSAQTDNCDIYASCGAYATCDVGVSQECQCLKGFVAQFPEKWDKGNWSDGCKRRTQLDCRSGRGSDGFQMYSGIKLPDTEKGWLYRGLGIEECRRRCLMNCACTAYSGVQVSGAGDGCLHWFDELIDIRVFKQNGADLYVRMAAADLGTSSSSKKRRVGIIVGCSLSVGIVCLCLVLFVYLRRDTRQSTQGNEELDIASFDYATISKATNHFSFNNKLGEGGFGPVYKGTLEGGQEIAVKVLSQSSRQGFNEFRNEVVFIAKLQHRNLVKILGCCIQREKMLIYEYMPNKSLDCFIFAKERKTLLDWPKRFHIINGISRGLLYLHQDSRLRIIHRDLKASNILLDSDMNPKISDFGLAKTVGADETEASTTRVVGTHGYMSPEYAIDGHFSIKSDVFSFGVLVLEIINGKRNRGFKHPDHLFNLLGHAWNLHKEQRILELIDPSVGDSCNLSCIFRVIHVGLLCVQQLPDDRPSMPSVVLMLGSDTPLPEPNQPGFYIDRKPLDVDVSTSKDKSWSTNDMSVTLMDAR